MAELTRGDKMALGRYKAKMKRGETLTKKESKQFNGILAKQRASSGNAASGSKSNTGRGAKKSKVVKSASASSGGEKKKAPSKRTIQERALKRVLNRWKSGKATFAEVDAVVKDLVCAIGANGVKSMCQRTKTLSVFKSFNKKRD